MHLSSRWGKPSYEIEALPISEFNKQKAFWEHCSWGMVDDLVALHHSSWVSLETRGKNKVSVTEVKKLALLYSAVRKVAVQSASSLRRAFMGIATAMKEKK
jgi:hypothetical protein